jgi:tetratricopeptide (TPR) repeat protein
VLARAVARREVTIPDNRTMLPDEVEAVLDYTGGLSSYHRNESWRRGVMDHFRYNLRRMVEMAHGAGVPVLLLNPVCNLDTPPFKSEHRAGMSEEELRRFDALWEQARQAYGRSLIEAIAYLKEAIDLDDQHAGIHFTLAECYQQLGRLDEACAEFVRAKDLDICPLRILEPMRQDTLEIARSTGTPLIDLAAYFAGKSPGGITGDNWLVDHVHPTIIGHQKIANLIFDEMVRLGYVHPVPGWTAERDRLYRKNYDSLDDVYYLMGQKHLENLRLWAQGRGDRTRKPSGTPKVRLAPARPIGGQDMPARGR